MMFFESYFCSLNRCFLCFSEQKKKDGTKHIFLVFVVFETRIQFSKSRNHGPVWFPSLKAQRTPKRRSLKTLFCFLNLVFFVLSMFIRKKQTGNQTYFPYFSCSLCFSEQKTVFNNKNQTGLKRVLLIFENIKQF